MNKDLAKYHSIIHRTKSNEGINIIEENNVYERNILNLVKEIQENQKKIEEKKKEKKRQKNVQNQYPKIKLTPLNNQTIQYILSCKLRTPNMLKILNAFLSTMKFLSISADIEDKEKLLYSLSFCLKMEKKPQGSIIFRYGNKGTRFYIVLGGEVSVLIFREKTIEIDHLNFIKYLLYLKIIKEDELAKKILATNQKSTFAISEKNLDIYYDDIISFINRYYNIVSVNEMNNNENNIEKKYSNKNIFQNYIQQENNEQESPRGLYDYNNNLDFENLKKDNKFFFNNIKKVKTMSGKKINSIINRMSIKNNLLNKEEKKENIRSDSDNDNSELSNDKPSNQKSKEKDKISKFKKLKKTNENNKDIPKEKEKEKPLAIKYKATSKIPNYLELDICTFSPSDISKIVNFVIKNLELIYEKTNKVISLEEYIKNCYIDESLLICDKYTKKEQVTIFQYFEITRKKEGDTFGELALQHNDNKRTATMITTKDSVFGYLSKHDYNNCLRGVEMKKRKIEVNFIMSFSLFDEMNWVNFEKTYFNYFKKEYLTSGQVIINQNDQIENIFFIMEGQIEITTNLNFNEINSILKDKNKRIKNKKNKYTNKDNLDIDKDDENKEQSQEKINNNKNNMDNNYKNEIDNINKKEESNKKDKDKNSDNKKFDFLSNKQIKELQEYKCFRLCVINNKDILGLNDICSKDGVSFVKATCLSSNIIIFSLKKNILDELKRKNSEIEKNVRNISNRREKIMIERLKITTNYMFSIIKENKINMSEVHKNDENKDNKNKNQRIRSAICTKYIPITNIENNEINNYLLTKNLLKKSSDKRKMENYIDSPFYKINKYYNLKKMVQNQVNLNHYNSSIKKDFSSNNLIYKSENSKSPKNFNLYPENDKNKSLSSIEKKSYFQKFMQSVTERVTQIQKTVKDAKFTGLFSPIYTRNIKLGSGKDKKFRSHSKFILKESNNKNIKKKILNLKAQNNKKKSLKSQNNSKAISNAANNFILINRLSNTKYKGYKTKYKLLEFDMKDDSLTSLLKNQKHIVQHQYTLSSKNLNNIMENKKINIITSGKKDPKKLAFSQLSRKNLNNLDQMKLSKIPKYRNFKISNFNPMEYMKIILGTRYREHEITKGQKKFTKMLLNNTETLNYFSNPEFSQNMNLFLNNQLYNLNSNLKPTKVDLLFYNKTIENNNDINFRAFSTEEETKRRIFSRNFIRRRKTICFTRTLTKSARKKS